MNEIGLINVIIPNLAQPSKLIVQIDYAMTHACRLESSKKRHRVETFGIEKDDLHR